MCGFSIYRFADLVNRQAIGEVIALTFFPLMIVMLTRLKKVSTGIGICYQ